MAGGMPPQGMQRPQPGNENDQIHGKIMEELRKMTMPQGGWQITLDLRERANWIMQLYVPRLHGSLHIRVIYRDLLDKALTLGKQPKCHASTTAAASKHHYASRYRRHRI